MRIVRQTSNWRTRACFLRWGGMLELRVLASILVWRQLVGREGLVPKFGGRPLVAVGALGELARRRDGSVVGAEGSEVAIVEEREVYELASERVSLVVGRRLVALQGMKVAASWVRTLFFAGLVAVQYSVRGRCPSCCSELEMHLWRAQRCDGLYYREQRNGQADGSTLRPTCADLSTNTIMDWLPYLNKSEPSQTPNVGPLQSQDQLLQLGIIAQRMTGPSTVIGIDESSISAKNDEVWSRGPSSRTQTLLDCLFQSIWKIMPPIAVFVAGVEATVWSKFDSEGSDVSLTGVSDRIDQPSLELWREVVST